jgi:hypothetical protein
MISWVFKNRFFKCNNLSRYSAYAGTSGAVGTVAKLELREALRAGGILYPARACGDPVMTKSRHASKEIAILGGLIPGGEAVAAEAAEDDAEDDDAVAAEAAEAAAAALPPAAKFAELRERLENTPEKTPLDDLKAVVLAAAGVEAVEAVVASVEAAVGAREREWAAVAAAAIAAASHQEELGLLTEEEAADAAMAEVVAAGAAAAEALVERLEARRHRAQSRGTALAYRDWAARAATPAGPEAAAAQAEIERRKAMQYAEYDNALAAAKRGEEWAKLYLTGDGRLQTIESMFGRRGSAKEKKMHWRRTEKALEHLSYRNESL